MKRTIRLALLALACSTLGACVLVPVGPPHRAYWGAPVVAPVGVVVRARC